MARTDITRYRGDTKDLVFKLTQNKEIFPLTGCSAKLSVSSEENPTTAPDQFTSVATINAAEGKLEFPMPPADVDLVGNYYYDVQLTDGDSKISTIRKGKLTFNQDITK